MSELIFGNLISGYVLFEENVIQKLNRYRQSPGLLEAGGILIGYRRPPHLHVVSITLPMKRDQRSAINFLRKDPRHSFIAKSWWCNSSEEVYYLGEWHTHPQDYPSPSFIDKRGWDILLKSKIGPDLLFLIVGKKTWYVQRRDEVIFRLDLIS
ncbi:MAG: Mov34/MPN/PAD-1 family protein [Candidatus Thiodiazotropha endolucinida]